MTRDEITKIIQDADLAEDVKATWIARVGAEGVTQEVLDGLQDELQEAIDKTFESAGVDISDTPEYKKEEAKMVAGVEAAKATLDAELSNIEAEAKAINDDTTEKVEQLQADAIKASIAE